MPLNKFNVISSLSGIVAFGSDLLMLDLVSTTATTTISGLRSGDSEAGASTKPRQTIAAVLSELDPGMQDRFEALRAYITALGDDVQQTILRHYIAFKHIQNFACVQFRPSDDRILVFVKLDPAEIALEAGFTREVTNVGHYGTSDVEITLSKAGDLEKAKPLSQRSTRLFEQVQDAPPRGQFSRA
jgi:predicted transport protein